jgi:hypothetical protein
MLCRLAAASTRPNRSPSKRIVTTTLSGSDNAVAVLPTPPLMLPTARILCVDTQWRMHTRCVYGVPAMSLQRKFGVDGDSPQKIARAIAATAGLRAAKDAGEGMPTNRDAVSGHVQEVA